MAREQTAARFWAKVDRSGGANACWPWLAKCDRDGYGRFKMGGRWRRASRVVWEFAHGQTKALVLHSCDNPPCVNPAHLFTGTDLDNALDRSRKGRSSGGRKLTEADASEIRALVAVGEGHRAIAARFGITRGSVSRIASGRIRKQLESAPPTPPAR